MTDPQQLGELEQLVLLTALRLGSEAHAIDIRRELKTGAGRSVSRGALYKTLERLETKGLLSWEVSGSVPERGGLTRRRFVVTPTGVASLRHVRETLLHLWTGLEQTLG